MPTFNFALLSLSVFLWLLDVTPNSNILSLCILFSVTLNAFAFSNKIVCLFRVVIFSLPALIFSVLQLIYGYDVYLTSFAIPFLSQELRDKAFLFLLISLASSFIGLSLAPSWRGTSLLGSVHNIIRFFPSNLSNCFVFLFSFFVVYGYGGFISESNLYGQKSSEISAYFATGQLFFYFLISIALVKNVLDFGFIRKSTLFVCIVSLLICMSGGGRLDFGPQVLLLLAFYFSFSVRRFLPSLRSMVLLTVKKRLLRIFIIFSLSFFIILGVFLCVGSARFGSTNELFNFNFLLVRLSSGDSYFFLDTFNSTIGGIYSVILRDTQYPSYFGFLWNLPPSFLGLPRLESAEWIISKYKGTFFTYGAVFEPTEAFLNFGILGVITVPLLISSFYSWLQQLLDNSLVTIRSTISSPRELNFAISSFVVVTIFILISPRGIWYQSFSLFRCLSFVVFLNFLGMISASNSSK